MFIFFPLQLIAFVTFPGVIVHEMAHRFFCDLIGIPVYEAEYFLIGEKKAGYIRHATTSNVGHQFLISIGPLIINTLLCALLTFPFMIVNSVELATQSPYSLVALIAMAWLGFSIGMHAFPSNQDLNVLKIVYKNNVPKSMMLRFIITIVVSFVRSVNIVPFFFLEPIYVYLISNILPMIMA